MLCSRLVRRALASAAATTTVRDLPAFFSLRPPKLYNSEWDACFSSQSQGREPGAGAILQVCIQGCSMDLSSSFWVV